jgi:hypothetical protein
MYFNLTTGENTSLESICPPSGYEKKAPSDSNSNLYLVLQLLVGSTGMLTSLVNISVLSRRSVLSSSVLFKHLLIMSTSDFLYSALFVLACPLKQCQPSSTACGLATQCVALFVDIGFNDWLTSCIAIFIILTELFLSLERLFVVMNRTLISVSKIKYFYMCMGVLSLAYYAPVLFLKRIVQHSTTETSCGLSVSNSTNSTLQFEYELTAFGRSQAGKLVIIVLSSIRFLLATIVLLALNLFTMYKLNYFSIHKDSMMTSKHTHSINNARSRNLSIMIIMISFTYCIGTTPYMIFYSLVQLWPSIEVEIAYLEVIGIIFLFLQITLKTFIYTRFNRLFRKQLFVYLNVICFVFNKIRRIKK